MSVGKRAARVDEVESTAADTDATLAEASGAPGAKEVGQRTAHRAGQPSHYLELFEHAPLGYVTLDDDGTICEANATSARLLGVERSTLSRRAFSDFVVPQDRETFQGHLQTLHGTGSAHAVELQLERDPASATPAGTSVFPSRLSIACREQSDGTPLVLVAFMDLSECAHSGEALDDPGGAGRHACQDDLFRAILDGTSDAVYAKDLAGRYTLFNRAAEQATGKSASEVLGRDDTSLFPPDEAAEVMAGDQRVIAGGVTTTYLERVTTADSGPVVFSSTKGPIRDSGGEIVGIFGTARDVTTRTNAELALAESERWLSESQRVARLGHYVFDIVNDWWDCSPALFEVFGIDEAHPRTLSGWLEVVHPDDREMMADYFQNEVIGRRQPFDLQYRIARPRDGIQRWVHGRGTVDWTDEGVPLRMFGVIQDITEGKEAQQALRERNAFIEAALDNAPIGFALNTIDDGRGVFVGRSFESIYGVPPGSLGGVEEFFDKVYRDPVVREQMRERVMADMASGDPSRLRWENIPITAHDGEARFVTATNIPLPDQNLMVSTVEDVTEKRRAEQALRESEARFRAVFEGAADGIMVFRMDGTLSFVNEAMARMHGYTVEEILKLNLADLDTPETHALAQGRIERLLAGERLSFEGAHYKRNGELLPIEVSASLLELGGEKYVLAFQHDITERKRAEEELERRGARLSELAEERERNLEQLAASLSSIIGVVGLIVETRDPYTAGHERRVAELSVRIAQELGMSEDDIEEIRIAGLLHDVGKISIPAEILSKPGRLTPIEFTLIQCHAEDSYRILKSANMGSEITEMVYQHHERCDGSGYPRKLSAAQLVEGAKVLMVADVVEAMSTDRPYRAALGVGPALAEIERGAGAQYDVEVSEACKRVFEKGFEFTPSVETDRGRPSPPQTQD